MLSVGVIGNGFVGQATSLFENENVRLYVYDIVPEKCRPEGLSLQELVSTTDMIFVCVPTPMKDTGECDTSIVESAIKSIRRECEELRLYPHIIVRSTVTVGFCDHFKVNHMPEFLTEANWRYDFVNTSEWIVGVADNGCEESFKGMIQTLLGMCVTSENIKSDKVTFVNTNTSEYVKYARNCFLAVKLSLCNEFYDFCQTKSIDYDESIKLIGMDPRIGTRYTKVPGPDGKKGWSGTCIPKDTASFVYQQKSLGLRPLVLESAIERNNKIDRVERDWMDIKNKGRTYQ